MQESGDSSARHFRRRPAGTARRARLLLCALVAPLLLAGLPALGADDPDEYDPTESGNPLRIAAYVVHPVGVILDTLIFRPAHWLGSKEPIKTLVGKTD
jgi:hypothetical protein